MSKQIYFFQAAKMWWIDRLFDCHSVGYRDTVYCRCPLTTFRPVERLGCVWLVSTAVSTLLRSKHSSHLPKCTAMSKCPPAFAYGTISRTCSDSHRCAPSVQCPTFWRCFCKDKYRDFSDRGIDEPCWRAPIPRTKTLAEGPFCRHVLAIRGIRFGGEDDLVPWHLPRRYLC